MKKSFIASLLATCFLGPVWADELALRIDHDIQTLSSDGVTRITRFSERLIRRDNQSWLARVIPAGAHSDAEHRENGKSHKHMDVSAAARWVTREDNGTLRVRLVNAHEKMTVDIAPVDYANIGFDGKWSSVSSLLEPEQIQRMKVSSRAAPADTRWYEGGHKNQQIAVLWDQKAQYPRRIESIGAGGLQRSTMVVTRETMPTTLPWNGLKGFVQKEYSDLLD